MTENRFFQYFMPRVKAPPRKLVLQKPDAEFRQQWPGLFQQNKDQRQMLKTVRKLFPTCTLLRSVTKKSADESCPFDSVRHDYVCVTHGRLLKTVTYDEKEPCVHHVLEDIAQGCDRPEVLVTDPDNPEAPPLLARMLSPPPSPSLPDSPLRRSPSPSPSSCSTVLYPPSTPSQPNDSDSDSDSRTSGQVF